MGFKVPQGINKIQRTVRIEERYYNKIEYLASKHKRYFNDIVNMMLEYAIDTMEDDEFKQTEEEK